MQIIYYNQDAAKRKIIADLANAMHIALTFINQFQGNITLQDIIDSAKSNDSPCLLPDIEVMIFHEFSDQQIDELLALMKQNDIMTAYQCVVTAHNQSWRIYDLFQELIKEREYFNTYQQLKECIVRVGELKEADYSEASWKVYEAAFMSGYFCLQKQSTVTELQEAIQMIQYAKKQLIRKDIS